MGWHKPKSMSNLVEEFEKTGKLHYSSKMAQEQCDENTTLMKEASFNEYKRSAKMTALNSAINLRPYVNSAVSLVATPDQDFDVIKKADEIYKWLLEI